MKDQVFLTIYFVQLCLLLTSWLTQRPIHVTLLAVFDFQTGLESSQWKTENWFLLKAPRLLGNFIQRRRSYHNYKDWNLNYSIQRQLMENIEKNCALFRKTECCMNLWKLLNSCRNWIKVRRTLISGNLTAKA